MDQPSYLGSKGLKDKLIQNWKAKKLKQMSTLPPEYNEITQEVKKKKKKKFIIYYKEDDQYSVAKDEGTNQIKYKFYTQNNGSEYYLKDVNNDNLLSFTKRDIMSNEPKLTIYNYKEKENNNYNSMVVTMNKTVNLVLTDHDDNQFEYVLNDTKESAEIIALNSTSSSKDKALVEFSTKIIKLNANEIAKVKFNFDFIPLLERLFMGLLLMKANSIAKQKLRDKQNSRLRLKNGIESARKSHYLFGDNLNLSRF
ncbi:hypothetical protein K502DRAFT_349621 [Neoconidiobolus thromboides FSU 785]|nr:hypothetical protein K502DRAFT_349621 [Neoconidiobolus thromboides FSU 785]